MPGARWRGPVPNMTKGAMRRPILGLVLHIQEGSEEGTNTWFHNPAANASAHFGAPKAGGIDQWVDTDDEAWAEEAGNKRWISIENEGHAGDSLTDQQVEACAQVLAWLAKSEGVKLQVAPNVSTGGLAYHSLGGTAWGHLSCPGNPIINQRARIVERAKQIRGTPQTTQEDDPVIYIQNKTGGIAVYNALGARHIDPTEWAVGQRLVAAGQAHVETVSDAEWDVLVNKVAAVAGLKDYITKAANAALGLWLHGDKTHPNTADSFAADLAKIKAKLGA